MSSATIVTSARIAREARVVRVEIQESDHEAVHRDHAEIGRDAGDRHRVAQHGRRVGPRRDLAAHHQYVDRRADDPQGEHELAPATQRGGVGRRDQRQQHERAEHHAREAHAREVDPAVGRERHRRGANGLSACHDQPQVDRLPGGIRGEREREPVA
jgi:hypothetical protein